MEYKVDWLIIGAGPAGLQLGYFLQKHSVNYVILEGSLTAGSFYQKFPRHKQLISINKVYTGFDDAKLNLRWDWNSLLCDDEKFLFKNYSKKYFPPRTALQEYLQDFANAHTLNIQYETRVIHIDKKALFIVTTDNGDIYCCEKLFVATGLFKPYIPKISGIDLCQHYADFSLNKRKYRNKRVLIIGKSNSALETANALLDTASLIHISSPHPLKMAWRSHYVGNIRAINDHFLETYQLKSQNAVINAEITRIEQQKNKYSVTYHYTLANDEIETLSYDAIIACTGFRFDASIFTESCQPKLTINDRFPEMNSHYESVNIPNLYFIGTLMQMRDFKKKQSGFIHGFRYNVAFLFHYLHNSYSVMEIPLIPQLLAEQIIQRVNRSSGLWQQTGYLADIVIYCPEQQCFKYYQGVPLDFAKQCAWTRGRHFFAITLDFGQERIDQYENIFAIDRIHKEDYARAALSTGLHPIIRHYNQGQLVSEHHVIEDFASVWAEIVHLAPLVEYLEKEYAIVNTQLLAEVN